MTLTDLSPIMRPVLKCLADRITATRVEIADRTRLERPQIGGALRRLEAYGLVQMPDERGAGWTITQAGMALCGKSFPPMDAAAPAPECAIDPDEDDDGDQDDAALVPTPEPEPDFAFADGGDDAAWIPTEEPMARAPTNAAPTLANEIIAAMELEIAMEGIIARLQAPIIPARTSRIYHRLVNALPESIIEVLAPITAMVKASEG